MKLSHGRSVLPVTLVLVAVLGAPAPGRSASGGPDLLLSGFLGGSAGDSGYDVVVAEDGSIYLTGETSSPNFPATVGDTTDGGGADAFVARVTSDGSGVAWATFLGGPGFDYGHGIDLDDAGNVYVTGVASAGFPATVGDTSLGGPTDAFVAKVDPGGSLLFSTFVGGSSFDTAYALALGDGAVFIAGETGTGAGFPTMVGPDTSFGGGGTDAFVASVKPDGSGVNYAGFVGGTGGERAWDVTADSAGRLYVEGETSSADLPAVVGPDTSYGGGAQDGFVARVRADGTGFEYLGFLGGSGEDQGFGVDVGISGDAYVTGSTESGDFPVVGGPDATPNGDLDVFLAKVSPDGSGFVYSGYLGGSAYDEPYDLDVDGRGNAYLPGYTESSDFPTAGGLDSTFNGVMSDGFIAKVAPDGAGLVYSGYLGGSDYEYAYRVFLDPGANAYVTGGTKSGDFPVVVGPDTSHNSPGTAEDAFLTKVQTTETCKGRPVTRLGSEGKDRVIGTGGPDVVLALGDRDTVRTKGGPDRVCAGKGNDKVKAGGGNDLVLGEGGRDDLNGGAGKLDKCVGGPGKDEGKGCEKGKL